MNENRRSFLKNAGRTALGVGCGLPLLTAGCGVAHGEEKEQWAMVIDLKKCWDLDEQVQEELHDACTGACNAAHSIPTQIPTETEDGEELPNHEIKWIWSEEYRHAFPEQSHSRSSQKDLPVLILCNHCTHPPCVKVCPTGATFKRKQDGIVTMDMHRCIGCRYCIAACPYGSRSFNWLDPRGETKDGPFIKEEDNHPTYPTRMKGVVEKCNFCVERIRAGGRPACVEAVEELAEKKPEVKGALIFGKLDEAPVSEALQENRTITRRPGLGTDPNVFYIV
jgi:Fe-S-cluster-containing dehydrogenase component